MFFRSIILIKQFILKMNNGIYDKAHIQVIQNSH